MQDENNRDMETGSKDEVTSELDSKLLSEVAENCDLDECLRLLSEGADVNARDADGCTPLLWAVLSGNMEVASLLIEKGADINSSNNDGETALHWASTTGNTEIAEMLISKGAEVNCKDTFGITPLRSASLNQDKDMIKILKKHGGSE